MGMSKVKEPGQTVIMGGQEWRQRVKQGEMGKAAWSAWLDRWMDGWLSL